MNRVFQNHNRCSSFNQIHMAFVNKAMKVSEKSTPHWWCLDETQGKSYYRNITMIIPYLNYASGNIRPIKI